MYKELKNHKVFIKTSLKNSKADLSKLLEYHKTKIEFFQHERHMHLLVMLFTIAITISLFCLTIFVQNKYVMILDWLFMCLTIPYIIHYYNLENWVQSLYELYDEIDRKML